MEEPKDTDTQLKEMENNYLEFLDDSEDQSKYTDLVKAMIEESKCRLIVNINDLRKKYPKRAIGLLNNTFEEQQQFQVALARFIDNVDSDYAKKHLEFFIGFEGSLGNKHVTPRTLTSRYLGNLVCVEGIVTKCSMVRPKIVKSVHYCPVNDKILERRHTDITSIEAMPSSGSYLVKDNDGNVLETEFGLSVYKDHQTVTIQEMPEKAPAGQMPRSVDIILDNDLADACKPGDRVGVVGGFRCLPSKHGGYTSGSFRTVVIANNVIVLTKEVSSELSSADVQTCKMLAKNSRACNVVDLLSKSLAPSIYGHEYVKKAILLLLLGGTEKVLHNGTRLRGDINILLIGDPSVAKSQLLRYVLCTAPRAIPTTGRGSSGVGLTAAVTVDEETGERRLEAGAMVLADRGVICIDEFDKMTDIDRTAIHEVMEQGRVTIAKAGIHATLNARCSVLAAANPVYGRYDPYKSPSDNIGLQDSLLSRFDLLFVLLDKADPELDHMISDHVVRMHRYRSPLEQDGDPLPLNVNADILSTKNVYVEQEEEANADIYEKYDPLLHGNMRSKNDQILTINFMRKYIQIAKHLKPDLTTEASKAIADEYSKLRSHLDDQKIQKTQPITARTLETLIRLSTAHAKARLSRKVTMTDARAAIELVQFAYFKRVMEKEKVRKRRNSDIDSDADEPASQNGSHETSVAKRTRRHPPAQEDPNRDPYEYDDEDDQHVEEAVKKATRPKASRVVEDEPMQVEVPPETVEITDERLAVFQKHLFTIFNQERTSSLSITKIEEFVTSKSPDFSKPEMASALNKMMDENKVMITDNEVMLI